MVGSYATPPPCSTTAAPKATESVFATSFADTFQMPLRYATIHLSLPVQDSGVRQALPST